MAGIIERIRKSWSESDDKRDAGLTTPENILRHDNLSYGSDGTWQKLDIYRPTDAGTSGTMAGTAVARTSGAAAGTSGPAEGTAGPALPVIVSVHGGAWVYGDKERYQFYCMDLARRGFAVVNFTYRLCPEFRFPAPLEDIDLVFRFIQEHAAEYGLDTGRVFAVGDSAGAHLLGLYLCTRSNPDFAGTLPFETCTSPAIRAAALNCGIYDTVAAYKLDPNMQEILKDFMPGGGSSAEQEQLSVISHLSSGLPPLYVMSSTDDFLKYQNPILIRALCDKNVPFTFRLFASEGREEKLYHVFHLNIRSREATACNDEECNFFKGLCNARP
ncbi:MAG: alpha/beta hydrolase [Treponema sp.]|nr:alpha/beta hydrolase [Treponema sp.]